MAERITRSHLIGLGIFWSVCTDKFEIRKLYAKNIMFACSLPTSTSTWRSDHRNGPGGYMSRELKSENIKYRKVPTRRSHHPAKRPTIVPSVTDHQDHASPGSHRHSRTVDLRHDCSYGICYLQDVGQFHYCFICYESFRLSHLLSVCLVL
jgi:hypothetical protein